MSPDVIVIGGGIGGTALTYALARAGARVMLLERGRIAGEASGATMGMALWISLHAEAELTQAVQGFQRLATLADELEADLSYRLLPSLVLAPDEAALTKLQNQAELLQRAGLPASQVIGPAEMAELEPALNPHPITGALYAQQAHLDGAALTQAYAKAAQRLGAEIREYASVQGFDRAQGRVIAVQTGQGKLSAGQVVLAAGAWTRSLASLAGVDLPIYYLHGEALATAPLAPTLHGLLMVARPDGYSALERRVAATLANGDTTWERWPAEVEAQDTSLVQLRDGRVLLGQITRAAPAHHLSLRPSALERIKQAAAQLVPALAGAPIQQSWIAPVAFTATQQAMLGPAPGYENLYVCAGFKSALITAPIACEQLARQMVASW
jgi:glycine/D-amino acid oxidase-like deaminating enzyme